MSLTFSGSDHVPFQPGDLLSKHNVLSRGLDPKSLKAAAIPLSAFTYSWEERLNAPTALKVSSFFIVPPPRTTPAHWSEIATAPSPTPPKESC